MTDKQYENLLKRGNAVLEKIMPELNKISETRIRKDNYRREEDCLELVVALGLYDEIIEGMLV